MQAAFRVALHPIVCLMLCNHKTREMGWRASLAVHWPHRPPEMCSGGAAAQTQPTRHFPKTTWHVSMGNNSNAQSSWCGRELMDDARDVPDPHDGFQHTLLSAVPHPVPPLIKAIARNTPSPSQHWGSQSSVSPVLLWPHHQYKSPLQAWLAAFQSPDSAFHSGLEQTILSL